MVASISLEATAPFKEVAHLRFVNALCDLELYLSMSKLARWRVTIVHFPIFTLYALEVGGKLLLGVGVKALFFAWAATPHESGTKFGFVTSRCKLSKTMSEMTLCTPDAVALSKTQAQFWLQLDWWKLCR